MMCTDLQGTRRRPATRTGGIVGLVLLLLAALASATPAAAQDKGERAGRVGVVSQLLIDQISKATGLRFAVKSVTGSLLSTITLHGVTVRDKKGLFATVGLIRLKWSPTALFDRNVRVDELLVRDVVLKRAPAKPPANAAPLDLSFLKLDVGQPVDIRFEKLKIENVVLEPAVYGHAGRFDVEGRLIAPRDRSSLDLDLKIVRKAGAAPHGHVIARLDDKTRRLKVDVDLRDPASGLVASLLGLPPRDAVGLSLQGDAPLADWHGKLALTGGSAGRFDVDIGVRTTDQGTRATIAGKGGSALLGRQLAGLGAKVSFRVVAAYGKRITIETLTVDGNQASLKGSGWLEPATNRYRLDLDARLDRFAAVEPLVGFPLRGKGRLKVSISGQGSRPTIRLDVEADALRLARLAARKAKLSLRLEPIAGNAPASTRRLALTLATQDAWLVRDDGGQDRLDALDLKLTGDVDLERRTAHDLKLSASVGGAKLTAAGNLDRLAPLKLDARIGFTGTVPDALLFGGRLRDATLNGTVSIDRAARKLALDLTGRAATLKTGVGWADALVAGPTRLRVDLAQNGDRITVKTVDVRTGNATITAAGSLAPGDTKGIRLHARIARLADVGRGLGRPMAGSLALNANLRRDGTATALRGTLTGDAVAVGRIRLGTVSATVTAADVTRQPHGRFELRLSGGNLTGRVGAGLRTTAAAVTLRGIDARLNAGRIRGAVAWRKADRTAKGRLVIDLRRLDTLLGLAGLKGSGRIRGTVTLDGRGGRQIAAADLAARRLVVAANGARYRVAAARLKARTTDAADFEAYRATLVASAVSAGAVRLDRARVSLRPGGRGSFAARLSATVNRKRLTAATTGVFRGRPGAMAISVTRFNGRYAKQGFRLTRPAGIRLRGGTTTVGPVRIALDGGTMTVRLTARNGALNGRVVARKLPARLLQLAGVTRISRGTLSGTARLYGRGRVFGVAFDVDGRGLRRRRAPASAALDLTAKGRWSPGLLKVEGRISGRTANDDLRFRVSLPRRGPIDARIQGRAQLKTLSDSGLLVNYRMAGTLTADLTVTGSAAAPQARGTLRLADGRFVNAVSGLDLRSVTLLLRGEGRRIVIAEGKATDGGSGRLKLAGSFTLDAARNNPFDVTITADRLRAIRRDDIRATVSGRMRIGGSLADITARGRLTVNAGEIAIPDRLPTSITVLDVIEIHTPPALKRAEARRPATLAPKIRLDLTVNVPGRMFIRGRGIFAEVRGTLAVKGMAANPTIRGSLTTVRGHLDLLGKRFSFTEGSVRFAGRDLSDPRIRLVAEATSADIKAIVTVTGTAKKPKFAVDSEPHLPRDEVLSRVMFGKDVGELSATDALRLAAGAAVLFGPSGGATSLPDRIRRAAGLDIIDIDTSTNGSPRAVFGKYVSDRVLVKVEQGLTQDSSSVGAEVEVLRNLSVDSKVSRDGSSRLGLKWHYDY